MRRAWQTATELTPDSTVPFSSISFRFLNFLISRFRCVKSSVGNKSPEQNVWEPRLLPYFVRNALMCDHTSKQLPRLWIFEDSGWCEDDTILWFFFLGRTWGSNLNILHYLLRMTCLGAEQIPLVGGAEWGRFLMMNLETWPLALCLLNELISAGLMFTLGDSCLGLPYWSSVFIS